MTHTASPPATALDEQTLPPWLATYTQLGLYSLVAGIVLCLLALFTNPIPDPSFPWYSLPEAYRLPVSQPRIEHWPVSYTVGIWLWIASVPALFLRGYERLAGRWSLGSELWLVGFPTVAMIGLTTYCRYFWPKPDPATWNAPAYTFVCWAYCSTYNPLWSTVAYAVAGIGFLAFVLVACRSSIGVTMEGIFGVLSLPLGLPVLFDAYRRTEYVLNAL